MDHPFVTLPTGWQQFLGARPGEMVRANIPISKMGWLRMKSYLDRHPLKYGYLFGMPLETHYLAHILVYDTTAAGEHGDVEKILTALFPKDDQKEERPSHARYAVSTIIPLLHDYFLSDLGSDKYNGPPPLGRSKANFVRTG